MNINEVLDIARRGEGQSIEFKEGYEKKDVGSTIASFATSNHGIILIGIKDNGAPVGVSDADGVCDSIESIAREHKIKVEVNKVPYNGNNIVVMGVEKGAYPPYNYRGVYFKRVDKSDVRLEKDEIARIILENTDKSFCSLGAHNKNRPATIWDIGESNILEFINLAKQNRNSTLVYNSNSDLKSFLKNLNLLENNDCPIYAAILMFGKKTTDFIPHSRIVMSKYPGGAIETKFIDRKIIDGDILQLVRAAEAFIAINTRHGSFIKDFKRYEVREYPSEVTREAIINAICHRDYANSNAEIFLHVFDDRIEILNPGGLPFKGLTAEQVQRSGGFSVRRNPPLAELLHWCGLMDRAGTGIPRMKELMRRHGLSEPTFEITQDIFKIILYGPGDNYMNIIGANSSGVDLSHLRPQQYKALEYVQERGTITNKVYSETFGVSERTASRHLMDLYNQGLVQRRGRGPSLIYIKS